MTSPSPSPSPAAVKTINDSAIRCQGLTRHYGAVKAVEDLDLSVPTGSIFGFLGRNGAGKTTTLRMIAGLAHPTRGRAWVMGIETTAADSSARRTFGYLPQSPAFYTWMTPVEYLDYVGRLFGLPAKQRVARRDEMLALADLKSAARRRIGGFSGGMIQRLGIAQAMLHEPPVLILDEPTSSLDPAGRYEVLDLIQSLRGRVTVLLSSHILADIERICDTIAIIHQGRLALVAGRDELLNRYASNAVELQVEPVDLAQLQRFAAVIQSLPWVGSAQLNQAVLRISLNDLEAGRQNLLPLAVEYNLPLTRFEFVRPSLEEIFLEVSS
jgi:ABC-2 type transport system ATP-binding protein